MTLQDIIKAGTDLVKQVPMDGRGRRQWQAAPDIAAKIAGIVITNKASIDVVADGLGMPRGALTHFTRGRNSSGNKCPAIAGHMKRAGIEPLRDGRHHVVVVTRPPKPIRQQAEPSTPVPAAKPAPWWVGRGVLEVKRYVDITGTMHETPEAAAKASENAKRLDAAKEIAVRIAQRLAGDVVPAAIGVLMDDDSLPMLAELVAGRPIPLGSGRYQETLAADSRKASKSDASIAARDGAVAEV